MLADTHAAFHKSSRADTRHVVGASRRAKLEKRERNAATAAWVKEIRARTGLSQELFADRLGVDRSMVGRWEIGLEAPNSVNTRAIASLVNENLPSRVLRTGDPQPGEANTMEAALLGLFRQLGAVEQARVLVYVEERVSARAAAGDTTSSQKGAAHRKG